MCFLCVTNSFYEESLRAALPLEPQCVMRPRHKNQTKVKACPMTMTLNTQSRKLRMTRVSNGNGRDRRAARRECPWICSNLSYRCHAPLFLHGEPSARQWRQSAKKCKVNEKNTHACYPIQTQIWQMNSWWVSFFTKLMKWPHGRDGHVG